MSMTRTIKMFKLPDEHDLANFGPMQPKHVSCVTGLLRRFQKKFDLKADMNESEVAHWLLPRAGVVNTYVVEDPLSHKVTDFCSFYHLPSTIIGNTTHKTLFAAYSFYNVATTVPLTRLMHNCLIMAKAANMDVFNALNLMENSEFLDELKFGMGSGELHMDFEELMQEVESAVQDTPPATITHHRHTIMSYERLAYFDAVAPSVSCHPITSRHVVDKQPSSYSAKTTPLPVNSKSDLDDLLDIVDGPDTISGSKRSSNHPTTYATSTSHIKQPRSSTSNNMTFSASSKRCNAVLLAGSNVKHGVSTSSVNPQYVSYYIPLHS
ncbi:hypothetical protein DYB28_015254 [Aphanomyces astaci]|uniref:Glycylpeptide N-tetradecanoyltransferase n=1 Tax=Aphanomyces astaci TaxID=112090 RepID=A0A9X8HAJ8_APHAT|nr:hypothetical protein DYB28_015254 [Aphanomyces astaci]